MVVPMKRILLIRHAECEMNLTVKGFIGGQSNASPLTHLGEQQAAALGRHLAKQFPGLLSTASSSQQQQRPQVHCSTAVRAARTAAIALAQFPGAAAASSAGQQQQQQQQQLQLPAVVQASPELLELSQGSWEGRPRQKCYTPEVLAQIQADNWNFAAPGGESQKQLEDRIVSYLKGVVLPNIEPGGLPALVVSHGLSIKCFLRSVLNSSPSMTWKIQLDNTSITEVMWAESGPAAGWHLGRVNDVTHLVLAGLSGAMPGQYVAVQEAEGEAGSSG